MYLNLSIYPCIKISGEVGTSIYCPFPIAYLLPESLYAPYSPRACGSQDSKANKNAVSIPVEIHVKQADRNMNRNNKR